MLSKMDQEGKHKEQLLRELKAKTLSEMRHREHVEKQKRMQILAFQKQNQQLEIEFLDTIKSKIDIKKEESKKRRLDIQQE